MKRGTDGLWRTVGGIVVSDRQQEELNAPSSTEQIATLSAKLAEAEALVGIHRAAATGSAERALAAEARVAELERALKPFDRSFVGMSPVEFLLEVAPLVRGARAALSATKERAPTHRHLKSGQIVRMIGIGKMQSAGWRDLSEDQDLVDDREIGKSVDMREVVIYEHDGNLWARPREEFEDGRFEALSATKEPGNG